MLDGYLIQLDGKTIKTPLRHPLCVPGEMLASAVANEWHMQSNEINTATMPLVSFLQFSQKPTTLDVTDVQVIVIYSLPHALPHA